jgi:4Fe-4S ferredoxin
MTGATERCEPASGPLVPHIDRNRCEGKADCVRVCPFDLFTIITLSPGQRAELPLLSRLRATIHGNKQAAIDSPSDCHACGKCVAACPENAITLIPA